MRKFIIDTDTGSDDAVALMLAAYSKDIEILGITTVCGNVPQELATKNALMTMEVCGRDDIPVYPGAYRPIFRELATATSVHGDDGMGDCDLIHPTYKAEDTHAVEFILETVKKHPGEIEIVTLGPVTNIALCIMKDPITMSKVKHIYSMATGGFGPGNTTSVAEFNVYADADSFHVFLESGIPITIIGFDLCLGPAALNMDEMNDLKQRNKVAKFAIECNRILLEYNVKRGTGQIVDLPDAVAMAVALWDDTVIEKVHRYCYCCHKEEPSYGQVVIHADMLVLKDEVVPPANAFVVKEFDHALYKKRLIDILSSAN